MKNNDNANYSDLQVQTYLSKYLQNFYPAKTAIKVFNKLSEPFDSDTRNIFKKLVLSDPRLYRLILTSYYEPLKDWAFRLRLWCMPTVFGIKKSQLIDFIIEDEYYIKAAWVYYYKSLTNKYEALNPFFLNLYNDFSITLRADMQKFRGREGTISELREKQYQTKEYKDGDILITETFVDNWPNPTFALFSS